MKEPETYCLCTCPICGDKFHEWIELYTPCVVVADVWCARCSRCVSARVIPVEFDYAW